MSIQDRLTRLGITLPPVSTPAAAYVPYVRSGALVFLSGHIAKRHSDGFNSSFCDGHASAVKKSTLGMWTNRAND